MKIIEKFTCSKSGIATLNEDCWYIDENFAVIVDGVTSKIKSNKEISDGRFAAQFVCNCFKDISPDLSPLKILKEINIKLSYALKADGRNGASACGSIIAYNSKRNELFNYGDCHFKVGEKQYAFNKKVETPLLNKRKSVIEAALKSGKTESDIMKDDIGRKAILNELIEASKYANTIGEFGYPVLNGGEIVEDFIQIIKVKKGETIILSSDGYPILLPTLKKTEEELHRLIKKDPLCINELIGTKCISEENKSYDDRTYIRIKA